MSRRFIDKAFSHAQFCENKRTLRHKTPKRKKEETTETTESADTIDEIIAAADKQDFLKVLGLPLPDINALGDPVWPYTDSHIRKCIYGYPDDKNTGEKARHAFQLLTHAYGTMLNEDKRNEILKSACSIAQEAKEKKEAAATVDERIKINAEKFEQKRKLNKLQHDKFTSEIVRQMKERKQQMSTKRQKLSTPPDEDGCNGDEGSCSPKPSQHAEHLQEEPDETEFAMMRTASVIKESEKQRVRRKLKADKSGRKVEEDASDNEWEGALVNKSKQQRRKPRFMF